MPVSDVHPFRLLMDLPIRTLSLAFDVSVGSQVQIHETRHQLGRCEGEQSSDGTTMENSFALLFVAMPVTSVFQDISRWDTARCRLLGSGLPLGFG